MADTTERHIALREAHQISASDSFFAARKELRDTEHERYIFDAGFRRGFDCHESLQRKAEATTPADAALADVVERVAVIWAPGTVRHRELMQAAAALRARAVPERFVDAANRAKNITADVLRTHPETYVAHIHGLADLILTLASRQSQETSVPKVLNDVLEIHGSNPRDDLSHDLAQDAARTAMLAMTAAITAMRNANYFVRDQIEAARRQESE